MKLKAHDVVSVYEATRLLHRMRRKRGPIELSRDDKHCLYDLTMLLDSLIREINVLIKIEDMGKQP